MLFRSTCPDHIQGILNFFDTVERQREWDVNSDKTEEHAIGSAAQRDFPTLSGTPLSTLHRHSPTPRTVYKYLGVDIYNNDQAHNTFDLAVSEI